MRSFGSRRRYHFGLFAIAAAGTLACFSLLAHALRPTNFLSGWILAGLFVVLAAYNIRKTLPFLPLGTSANWLQLHIYIGLLSGVLFAVHIQFRLPNGAFETGLAVLYLTVFLSGVGGLVLSRVAPPRLTTNREEVLFERIPFFMKQIRDEAEQMALTSISETETTEIAEFYLSRLKPFFDRPRHFWRHLMQSNRPLSELLQDIRTHERFLNSQERDALRQIADLVRVKDDLDHQYALQWTLKRWLFVHVPLTYALAVVLLFHIVIVYAFAGGMQ